jgi:hypothetical protein
VVQSIEHHRRQQQVAGDAPARARLRLTWRWLRERIGRLEAGLTRWESLGILFMALVVGVFVSLWV